MKTTAPRALLFALLLACQGCGMLLNLLGKPKVEVVRPRIEGIDWDGVNLRFDLEVRNRWLLPLRGPLARWRLDIQGREFIRSETRMDVALPARGAGSLSVPVHVSYPALWGAYAGLRGAQEVEYTFRGVLATSVLGLPVRLPVSHSDKFPVLRPPQVTNVRVRIGEASLLKATLIIEADATNPNAFDLDVSGLGYVLKAGEVQLAGLTASTAGTIGPGKTGQLSIVGEVSAARTLLELVRGGRLDKPSLVPTGSIKTPHGMVILDRKDER